MTLKHIYIAHRGNLNGPDKTNENSPGHIERVLAQYDWLHCEVDAWLIDNQFYLGHDEPQYEVFESFLTRPRIWCHAKNIEALSAMLETKRIHCFWHQTDDFTITSRGYIWTYPGKQIVEKSIAVCLDGTNIPENIAGVCTDYPLLVKEPVCFSGQTF